LNVTKHGKIEGGLENVTPGLHRVMYVGSQVLMRLASILEEGEAQ
jgi:hypothetical protein